MAIQSKIRVTQKVEYRQTRKEQLIVNVESHEDVNNECCDV